MLEHINPPGRPSLLLPQDSQGCGLTNERERIETSRATRDKDDPTKTKKRRRGQ
jgi:hypothetical protein